MRQPVPGGRLSQGATVSVNGFIPPHSNRFKVNLLLPNGDVALHFNVRFDESCVVRNTQQHGRWMQEERHGGMPFQRGQMVQIQIRCEFDCYRVSVNGQDFIQFPHRLPMEQVNSIECDGDFQSQGVQVYGGMVSGGMGGYPGMGAPGMGGYPGMGAPGMGMPPGAQHYPSPGYPSGGGYLPAPLFNPGMPVNYHVPGGVCPGRMLVVVGVVRQGGEGRFNINIQDNSGQNIALHFDVRMNYGGNQRQVVRTNRTNGNWGHEERNTPYFPFEYNAQFTLFFKCEHNHFKVAVNNNHFVEFHHRSRNFAAMDNVQINGDCEIMEVRVQNG